jgi:hypothetical protein
MRLGLVVVGLRSEDQNIRVSYSQGTGLSSARGSLLLEGFCESALNYQVKAVVVALSLKVQRSWKFVDCELKVSFRVRLLVAES